MRKTLILFAIIAAVVVLAIVSRQSSSKAEEFMIDSVDRGRVAASVLASGTLNFREVINLRTEVTGRIEQILVEEGDNVKKDDTLLVISPELFEAELKQQQASVSLRQISIERQKVFIAQLKRSLERQKNLFETGHVNQDTFENLERDFNLASLDLASREKDLEQAEALLSASKDRLEKTVIKAPIDGVVTTSNAKIGETVVAGTTNIIGSALMDVADPSAVIAEVQVAETDILAVKVGQKASVTTVADPDNPMPGEVISIGTTARQDQNQQNSFLVKILLDPDSGDFSRLAISCRAEIYTDIAENVIRVPVEAVLADKSDEDDEPATQHVFIDQGGVAKKRVIETGIQTDTRMEITSGLSEGDLLIIGPYRKLRTLKEGTAVIAREDQETGDKDND